MIFIHIARKPSLLSILRPRLNASITFMITFGFAQRNVVG